MSSNTTTTTHRSLEIVIGEPDPGRIHNPILGATDHDSKAPHVVDLVVDDESGRVPSLLTRVVHGNVPCRLSAAEGPRAVEPPCLEAEARERMLGRPASGRLAPQAKLFLDAGPDSGAIW